VDLDSDDLESLGFDSLDFDSLDFESLDFDSADFSSDFDEAPSPDFSPERGGVFLAVIRHVPARAFELDGGLGKHAPSFRAALWAFLRLRGGMAFDFSELVATLLALIFV